jgi:2,3-diketo-5-methylthio-1-phosphopentane phosphatase
MSDIEPQRLHVFCDFDGTITRPDTIQFLTERFGGGAALYKETGRRLDTGEVTLRDALAGDLGSIRVPFTEVADALVREITIDPGFRPFARWCAGLGVRLTILSAGFMEIIDLVLVPAELPAMEIHANRFEPGTWRCIFYDDTPLGHDKSVAVRAAKRAGYRTVFVGDGFSDREPAAVADLVFARRGRSLVDYCRRHGIACVSFDTFFEVQQDLQARLRSVA